MSQTTLTSFFTSRKRPASDDISGPKNKVPHLDRRLDKGNREKLIVKKPEIRQNEETIQENTEQKKSFDTVTTASLSKEHFEKPIETATFAKKSNIANINKLSEPSKYETISTARKELSLGEIRKKIAGSSRLAELKTSADRISKGIQQLIEASDTKKIKEFKFINVEVHSSPSKKTLLQNDQTSKEPKVTPQKRPLISPRKVVVSPIKSPSKVPAYMKQSPLSTSSTSLPLPYHYRFLGELFRGMETVVAMLYNRNEKITFTKLKPSVQEMLKKNFTEQHLAQIKHLVPDFYNFEVQKIQKNISTSCQKDAYELVISPNFPNDIKVMNPSVLLERRRYFYDTLLQLVKKHHAQFILTLDPPMVLPDNKLCRWHPKFDIEKIPDVASAKLPEVPNSEKYSTAQDVLAKARELFKCNTKMERALQKFAQAKARGLTDEEKAATGIDNNNKTSSTGTQTNQPSASTVTLINPAFRNLPTALLEKVKAKQAAKALEAMTRSSDCEQKYIIYSRLPDLARTLRNIFVTERKNVLALNIILSKLDSSFKSNVSANHLQRDIKLLAEEVPEWITIHEIRNSSYIKLDKSADLNTIIDKLKATAAKYNNDSF